MTPVPFAEAARTWLRIGLISFGGPAGQIAVMHRILVDEKRWIDEPRFLHALNYCMLLPGPEAQQLSTYIGWLMHGTRGGLTAGVLFVLPGFLAILALSITYVLLGDHPLIAGALIGLKAAVIALVVEALLRIARRALAGAFARALAALAFIAIAALAVPFPVIIMAAALAGFLAARGSAAAAAGIAPVIEPDMPAPRPTGARAVKLLAVWVPLWFAPVLLCVLLFGAGSVYADIGVFFSKMAVVTFGGAYAVLTYVSQQAVERFAWLTPAQMIDGLGLAETTPGPLILVVQFVAFLAAYQAAGDLPPLLAGVLGAALAVWVTFAPCFLWIFLGAPYVERLRGNANLAGALAAITAAVVGVIANLALWFAMHALFARTAPFEFAGLLRIQLPLPESLRLSALALTLLAFALLFVLRQGLSRTVAICAAAGAAASFAGLT